MPMIAFNGVRNSWLIAARKSDLARLASSARAIVHPYAQSWFKDQDTIVDWDWSAGSHRRPPTAGQRRKWRAPNCIVDPVVGYILLADHGEFMTYENAIMDFTTLG